MPFRVYLVGFMGSGKTTIGKESARLLGWDFIDLDERIEAKAHATIRQIIETEGESGFREKERAALHQSADIPTTQLMVATGGGVPCFFDNLDWIHSQGISVFLDPGWEAIRARLAPHRYHRPLLQGDADSWSDRAKTLYESRLSWYAQATLRLHGEDASVKGLIEGLNKFIHS